LLNKQRVFNWLKHNGVVKGNIVKFSEKPIASVPFRKINWENKAETKIHENITKFCKNYITSKNKTILSKFNQEFDKLF